MASEQFHGEITVASRIVDQLSSGLYESPAACLKELINNAYDADARRVDVFIKPDADRIIIEDDGTGMSRTDFITHFQKISESHKRDAGDVTKLGRMKIGKIGIGFIAANEICDTMELVSQKKGSREQLRVEIHFDKMRQDPSVRRRPGGDMAKGDYTGVVEGADPGPGYTQLVLRRVRKHAKQLFAGETNLRGDIRDGVEPKTLYGLKTESVQRLLSSGSLGSWSDFDSYSQNMLRVALNVPVRYAEEWLPDHLHKHVADLERAVEGLKFEVFYDGTELRKPVILCPPEGKKSIISRFDFEGDHVGAKGYFYAQHGVIRPKELHGLLLRIRQSAVGGYDSSFLEYPPSEGSIIQRWISAEVWADDRLEDALNIDRKTLRVSHPAYVELRDAVHQHLTKVIRQAREKLYDTGSEQRQQQKADVSADQIRDFAISRLKPLDAKAASQVLSAWAPRRGSSRPKNLVKKFSVAQLYEIVLEVAEEVLTPEQLRRFVRLLTDRMTK